MQALREGDEGYKCLGVLEADDIKHESMEKRLSNEYTRRVKKILRSKLRGGNMIRAINTVTWVVSLLRYSTGVVR